MKNHLIKVIWLAVLINIGWAIYKNYENGLAIAANEKKFSEFLVKGFDNIEFTGFSTISDNAAIISYGIKSDNLESHIPTELIKKIERQIKINYCLYKVTSTSLDRYEYLNINFRKDTETIYKVVMDRTLRPSICT